MTQALTHSTPLVRAMAQMLHDAGFVQYNSSGGYTDNPNKPAVVFGVLPVSPVTAVSIIGYNEDRSADDDNPDLYVQLRFRANGSPLAVDRLADSVFARLHWSENHPREIWPGGVAVLLSRRVSRTPVMQAGTSQYERMDSYRLHVNPGDES